MYLESIDSRYYETADGRRGKKAIQSDFLRRIQIRHFLLFTVLPPLGTAVAIALLFWYPLGWPVFAIFLIMWSITSVGQTLGYHRLFAHASFKAHPAVRAALAIAGSMAGLGSLISWTAMHRRHHECSDKPGDMHSPNLHGETRSARLRGFVHAHFTWMMGHEYPNVNYYTPELMSDYRLLWISRHYMTWVVLGLALPTAAAALITGTWIGALNGFLWGGAVRMFVVSNAMWSLNSFLHIWGSKPYKCRDHSGNSGLLALFSWGEGWHHNHHAFPHSASFALTWYRVDPGYYLIRLLQALGLVWDVKTVPAQRLAERAA
jgi:stearoyl-CoA desaturase (Delta-9 desaturase)